MPPTIRLSVLLVLALGVACSSRIQHGLDERQANEIQSVLVERGLQAQKVIEPGKKPTWAIEVDEEHATDAVRVLAELGLPKQKTEGFGEVFGKGSLVPSASEERALYLEAMTGELARTLEAVDGVTSARVHLVLPFPGRSSNEPPVPSKASAFLRVRPHQAERLNQSRAELKALIAGSVDGLTTDSVTLVINEVSSTVPAPSPGVSPLTRLRAMLLALGILVSLMGALLVGMTLRLRAYRRAPAATGAPLPVATLRSPVPIHATRQAALP